MATCPLCVLNRLVAEGKIARYAIAMNEKTWRPGSLPGPEAVDIVVALPKGSVSDGSDERRLFKLLAAAGYSEPGSYGVQVEGWGIRFVVLTSDLGDEALDNAIERQFTIEGCDELVTAPILRLEYFAALMLSWDTMGWRDYVIALIEDERVDFEALSAIASRHELKASWDDTIH